MVGAFASPDQAQDAAAELARLLAEVAAWCREPGNIPEEWEPPLLLSAPEAHYAAATGIPWNPSDPSLYSPDAFYEGITQAITVWGPFLFIHSASTWQWPTSYRAFMEHRGGKAAIDWAMDASPPMTAALVMLSCQAPDSDTATALCSTIQAVLGKPGDYDDFYGPLADAIPWGNKTFTDNYDLAIAGQCEQEAASLQLHLRFWHIKRGLPALVGYLEEQGCSNIRYDIGEWNEATSGAPWQEGPSNAE